MSLSNLNNYKLIIALFDQCSIIRKHFQIKYCFVKRYVGLDMIKIINEVRARVYRESGVDVNMRIGVHSGNIISGILGTNKWQYDVWSRDVVIANKMEQTGKPGKVHVTQQTLDLVNASDYNYIPVERLDDEVLRKYGIRSYLITPSLPETPMRCVSPSGVGKS